MSKAEETRQYIIEKAAPIFNMHGYEGTSMTQLTKAINMTKGAIYGNFKDKDEIALAAFDYNFAKISKQIEKAVQAQDNACDKLIAFANFYLDEYTAYCASGGCPVLNTAIDSDNVHPPLKQKVKQAIDTWMEFIVRILDTGIKKQEINRNIKPEPFASIFVSLIEGGIMLSRTTGNTIHLSRSIDHLIHLVNTELRA